MGSAGSQTLCLLLLSEKMAGREDAQIIDNLAKAGPRFRKAVLSSTSEQTSAMEEGAFCGEAWEKCGTLKKLVPRGSGPSFALTGHPIGAGFKARPLRSYTPRQECFVLFLLRKRLIFCAQEYLVEGVPVWRRSVWLGLVRDRARLTSRDGGSEIPLGQPRGMKARQRPHLCSLPASASPGSRQNQPHLCYSPGPPAPLESHRPAFATGY